MAVAAFAMSFLGVAKANTWTKPAGGLYETASNWSPANVPGPNNSAIFALNANYGVIFNANEQSSVVEVDAGTASFNLQTHLYGVYSLTVSSSSSSSYPGLNVNNGYVYCTTNFQVGKSTGSGGKGLVALNTGSTLTDYQGTLGVDAGAYGELDVTQGSLWNSQNFHYVGESGTGVLKVSGGGDVSDGGTWVGHNAGSDGTVTISGAGSSWNSSQLVIGDKAIGRVTVDTGGSLGGSRAYLGYDTQGNGTATIDGTGSNWTVLNDLDVGLSGQGSLVIQNGGSVWNTDSVLSSSVGSLGSVTITDSGSTWTNAAKLYAGRGTGFINVLAGGVLSTHDADIGIYAGSYESVIIDGAASKWNNSNLINIGKSGGTASLTISNGGQVSSQSLQIASGGSVAGDHGTIVGDVTNSGKVQSSSVLTVTGNYFQTADATLELFIQGTGGTTNTVATTSVLAVSGNLSLDGTLKVTSTGQSFAIPALGNTFDLLDWGTLIGTFSNINLPSLSANLGWDTSKLYTTGVIRVVSSLVGDFNGDGIVDMRDYVRWRDGMGTLYIQSDYGIWRSHFGTKIATGSIMPITIPEPTTISSAIVLLMSVLSGSSARRRVQSSYCNL